MPAQYPDINGLHFDWSSVEININGVIFKGCKELNYSHKLEPGKKRGTTPAVQGRSRGQYDAEGSVTIYFAEALDLLNALGPGYMERSFEIVSHYADTGQPVVTVELVGCRIKNEEDQQSESGDVLATKFDLDIIAVKKNGIVPVSGLSV